MDEDTYPLSQWQFKHPELRDTQQWHHVEMLGDARFDVWEAISLEEKWEAWQNDMSKPLPDLIKCIGLYGHMRMLIHGWEEFPIPVVAGEEQAWRDGGLGASLQEFREQWIAGVAGGFLELANHDPQQAVHIIKEQLRIKLEMLLELVDKPLDWYTPKHFEAYDYDEQLADDDRRDKPFQLLDDLAGFRYALPKLRMFCITEEDAELGLPSPKLYQALMEIDLNEAIATMQKAEAKLKPILQHLADHNDSARIRTAPKSFWWRHWQAKKPHHDTRKR